MTAKARGAAQTAAGPAMPDEVAALLARLEHPREREILAVRAIILGADDRCLGRARVAGDARAAARVRGREGEAPRLRPA